MQRLWCIIPMHLLVWGFLNHIMLILTQKYRKQLTKYVFRIARVDNWTWIDFLSTWIVRIWQKSSRPSHLNGSLLPFSCCFCLVYSTFHVVITCEMTKLRVQCSNEKTHKGAHLASRYYTLYELKSFQLCKHVAFHMACCGRSLGLHGHRGSCWHCYHCISC